MKMKQLILIVFIGVCGTSCTKEKEPCDQNVANRKGAVCKDGTITNRTDSAACDLHGGLREWRCK